MGFPDGMRAGGTVMDEVKRWHAVTLAVLAMAFPLCWFLSEEAAQWLTRALFWLLVARVLTGERSPCRDTVVQLCVLLALTVVLGYLWQQYTVPEALRGGFSARKYIPALCFFVAVAYGAAAVPWLSPFWLLISFGVGLSVHLTSIPMEVWLAAWQGARPSFGFRNAQHTGVVFATALLAGTLFLPRSLSGPPRVRLVSLPVLIAFILVAAFGVIVTQTRAIWLGLTVAGGVVLLAGVVALFCGKHSVDRHSLVKKAAVGICILLAGAGAFHFGAGDIIARRLASEQVSAETITQAASLETAPQSSITVRIGSWSAALEWIAERPVFGWGGRAASRLIDQSPHFDEQFKSHFGHLHNSYLETLLNVGGATMACIVVIVLLVARRIAAGWRAGRIPTDVFLFACTFYPFWATVNMFESYILYDTGFLFNALIGGFVYSWHLRETRSAMPLPRGGT